MDDDLTKLEETGENTGEKKKENEEKKNNEKDMTNSEDDNGNEQQALQHWNTKMKISSSTSSSSSSAESDGQRTKKKSLKEKLKEAREKLGSALERSEELQVKLQEETDAKERVEGYLKESQEKQEESLSTNETLQSKLNNTEHYCWKLEKELERHGHSLPAKEGDPAGGDSSGKEEKDAGHEGGVSMDSTSEELLKLQATVISNNVIINTYLKQIEGLDRENTALKKKLDSYAAKDEHRVEDEQFGNSQADSDKDIEIKELQENLEESQKKYNEAIIALKEVQEAYGNMRDDVLIKYKDEVANLKSKVQNAENEHGSNEGVVTGLRQEVLDARLALERCKQGHKDKVVDQQKQLMTLKENIKVARESISDMTTEIEKLKEKLGQKDDIQHATEKLSNDRMQMINSLKTDAVANKDKIALLNNNLKKKEEEIGELRSQIIKQADMLNKENAEKEKLLKEVEEMEELREENQSYIEEIEELKSKVKMKKMKVKYVKKQMSEIEDQKEKLDAIAFVIPEMQKKVEQLEEDKAKLKEELAEQIRKEKERIRKIEEERLENEERIQREKENWERRLLGMGECTMQHEHDNCGVNLSQSFNRPNSAPLMKPRPPSARRYHSKTSGHHNRNHSMPSGTSLNPHAFSCGPEGRKTSEKVRSRQQRIIMNGLGKNRERLFRSATLPMEYISSYSQVNDNHFFPNLKKKSSSTSSGTNKNISPRVLVWGSNEDENAGKKLVAVGDRVSANIMSDCNHHGRAKNESTGLVKFIGFIEGNTKDVYIGLRMDEEVGNTDGTVEGKRYFRCEQARGKFIRLDDIIKVLETHTTHHKIS